ncbi:hypothetical protein ACFVU0_17810 [Streptomyces sp. NPDC058122]|uniref:hypothetical protein n=1 Tax=Streptomyces sp. NPDC058122 TaxID=3346349 RepID=UPI0036EDE0E2
MKRWGRELTACVPADLERFFLHAHLYGVLNMSYGPRGNLGVYGLGLVVQVQDIASGAMTWPVIVDRTWARKCTNDWEGAIPVCK